ncbi:putative DNA primase small subunit protein [Marine Group I thaumarchaeote SCGC AAA799-E16]|uniref:DNA primase small subunit PriS n=2 Tax=Marine Group I TaxID=905826 RepID=A0A087S4Z2_9ARCH|nr:putative DNA primase small subunit protein [Marine Group I thaumarchaeote SCGC AAA799-E16]KFM20796.1 putative DNA primase small subunit protein [Marine Group I thaumarchaeote SCGC RSA3]
MKETDIKFLEGAFKKYYFEQFDLIRVPERTSEREFGYQKFDSGMTRHISVKDDKELHLLLMQNVPSDVYCSNAYYSFPNLPMNEKDWKEADLIFDIDAKDLNLSCRVSHTLSVCNECNEISNNSEKCLKCNSPKLEKKSLPCKNCIDSSKTEVSKLSEILTNDFSINQDDIQVYFSGNEGFHIYVYNSQFQQIGSRERSELVDYIMFNGAIPEKFGMKKFKPNRNSFPNFDESGWRGRFSKCVYSSKSKRSKIISELLSNGYSSFQKTLDDVSEHIGTKIDPNVTMDIHRIFRLPGSINSKSGLTKIHCKDLEKFNAYTDSSFLSDDSVEIMANCPIEFKLKNKKFGPYNNEKVSVPTFAAVYMICKKLATIA